MPDSELDRIDPVGEGITLKSGMKGEVTRIRTRQLFRLLKVLTHGAGQMFLQMALDFNAAPDEFGQKLLMTVLISIPDAEQEAIDFVQSIVRPVGIHEGPPTALSKKQLEQNAELWAQQGRELFNPELDDLVTIFEVVIRQEAGELQALGKRLAGLLPMAQKLGQTQPGAPATPPTPEQMAQAETSLASSQPSST